MIRPTTPDDVRVSGTPQPAVGPDCTMKEEV